MANNYQPWRPARSSDQPPSLWAASSPPPIGLSDRLSLVRCAIARRHVFRRHVRRVAALTARCLEGGQKRGRAAQAVSLGRSIRCWLGTYQVYQGCGANRPSAYAADPDGPKAMARFLSMDGLSDGRHFDREVVILRDTYGRLRFVKQARRFWRKGADCCHVFGLYAAAWRCCCPQWKFAQGSPHQNHGLTGGPCRKAGLFPHGLTVSPSTWSLPEQSEWGRVFSLASVVVVSSIRAQGLSGM